MFGVSVCNAADPIGRHIASDKSDIAVEIVLEPETANVFYGPIAGDQAPEL